MNNYKRHAPTYLDESIDEPIFVNPSQREKGVLNFLLEVRNYFNLQTTIRVAGGWPRDKLLNKESHDLDIALDDMFGAQFAEKIIQYLQITSPESHIPTLAVFKSNPDQSKHLETCRLKLTKYDYEIDLVNLRSETYCDDSRIPSKMTIGTPLQDAERRDLTINSLFVNVNRNFLIEDFTGQGVSDLKKGIIRTPLQPLQTFLDDPLRVLRAFRFASRFGYEIDQDLLSAATHPEICNKLGHLVSKERIGSELKGTLDGDYADKVLKIIFNSPLLLDSIIPYCWNDIDIEKLNKELESYLKTNKANHLALLSIMFYQGREHIVELPKGIKMPLFSHILHPFSLGNTLIKNIYNVMCSMEAITNYYNGDISMASIRQVMKSAGQTNFEVAAQILRSITSLECNLASELPMYLETFTFKPILSTNELLKLLDLKPGMSAGSINKIIFRWQLSQPDLGSVDSVMTFLSDTTAIKRMIEVENDLMKNTPPAKFKLC